MRERLTRHAKTHYDDDEKRNACVGCGKSFRTASNLKQHFLHCRAGEDETELDEKGETEMVHNSGSAFEIRYPSTSEMTEKERLEVERMNVEKDGSVWRVPVFVTQINKEGDS